MSLFDSNKLRTLFRKVNHSLRLEIWNLNALDDKSLRGRIYALLRMFSLTIEGLTQNKILSRAAALSFSSLIGIGPLLAIGVMISGFILESSDSDITVNNLNRFMKFVAPPLAEYSRLEEEALNGTSEEEEVLNNSQFVSVINNIIESAKSGTVGFVGALILITIGIQLLTSIESAFNEIWGVRRGRRLFQRIVFYWTFISLGAILSFAIVTVLSVTTILRFISDLPFGDQITGVIFWMTPLFSFTLIIVLLMAFYRFIPNTIVSWRAAFIGSLIVAALLILNNYLSFLYVERVISNRSLYGSVAIVPILMFGLYVFWLFILLGGQITYSVHNANYLTNREAWHNISTHTREILSLAAYILIGRRFKECKNPYTLSELSEIIRAPGQILNDCLNRLGDQGWISAIPITNEEGMDTVSYQPAKPLNKMTLAEFKNNFESHGSNIGSHLLHNIDPLIDYYDNKIKHMVDENLGVLDIEALMDEHHLS